MTNILDFTDDSRLLHVPIICLAETHLLPLSNLSGIPFTYQIIRNDDVIDKFKSIAVSITKRALIVWNKSITMLCFISNLQPR